MSPSAVSCRFVASTTILAGSLAAVGCMTPLQLSYLSGSRRAAMESDAAPSDGAAASSATATDGAGSSQPATKDILASPTPRLPPAAADDPLAVALQKSAASAGGSSSAALQDVLGELREIRAIDPAAEEQLLHDLSQAKPEFYPLIVQQFRAALEYRRQQEQRLESQASPAETSPPVALAARRAAAPPPAQPPPLAEGAEIVRDARLKPSAEVPREEAFVELATPPPLRQVAPPRAALRPEPPLPGKTAEVTASDLGESVRQASYHALSPQSLAPLPTSQPLDAAVEALEHSLPADPASVGEVADHLRLRTLQMLAGRGDDAYRAVPGASPAVQDFWANQLYAMDAYLDSAAQPDEKRRASAALVHLDQARAHLAELANLQIRNLTFVEGVDGYGAYQPRAKAEFRPGQQVALYAEVRNYRSDSQEEGYRTALGTSYQVLDQAGQRVEGFQFPDIIDVCRSRRDDFHVQYDLTLPKQIYQGSYQLELTVTDRNANKIGSARLPFTIRGEQR